MKVIVKMMLMAAATYFALMSFPWWFLALIAFLISVLLPTNDIGAFIGGFLAIGLLWLVLAWKIDVETDSILSQKIANLFPVGGEPTTLVIISGAIGGLVGGFSSLSGNLLRKIWMKKKQNSLYH